MDKKFPRFYYADGSHSDAQPKETIGIQAIVQHTPFGGTFLASGDDYYIFDNGQWIGVDLYGALDWMMHKGYLLSGRTINDESYSKIINDALDYRDLMN